MFCSEGKGIGYQSNVTEDNVIVFLMPLQLKLLATNSPKCFNFNCEGIEKH